MTQDNFDKELKLINSDMQLSKAAVSSPYLYTLGYEKLLACNSLENLGMSSTLVACRMRVKKMFEEAKWPRAAGELVLPPINDQTDSQVMRGKFIDAMNKQETSPPLNFSLLKCLT